ncbi:MAG: radical SAM protein [Deltaproteobacteria bacterium]|nr:radical SAM protein [Deltaproteobacteria bacterium]
MQVITEQGNDEIARVYVVRFSDGSSVECVESIQPPFKREDKWVLIISTLRGCPVKCIMCDAGGYYTGKISREEMIQQIDMMVRRRYPDGKIPCRKFKIQFARMGDPAFNMDVISVLNELPELYDAPGLMPSISTIAPASSSGFMEELIDVVHRKYSPGFFQMQFSLHTTDIEKRKILIPTKTMSFGEMALWGEKIYRVGDRKVTLNFAGVKNYPMDAKVLREYFDPERFIVKLTPVNPTRNMKYNNLQSAVIPEEHENNAKIVNSFKDVGYEVILSIGELEENAIGSNCGMYAICDETMNQKRV